jgi:hypothetical protein
VPILPDTVVPGFSMASLRDWDSVDLTCLPTENSVNPETIKRSPLSSSVRSGM